MDNLWLSTSKIIQRVKARVGAGMRNLELDDDAIAEILRDETLPTLSVYFPKIIHYIVDMKNDMVDGQPGMYYVETPTQLLGAELLTSLNGIGSSTTFYDRFYRVCPFEFVLSFLQDEIANFTAIPYTVHFLPPNKINIAPNPPEGMNDNRMALKLKVAHSDFTEFHPGLREYILQLAACDIRMDILGFRHVFTNVNTTQSEIELYTGTYEDAVNERKELLEKFRQNMHLSSNRRKIWTAF